MRARSLWYVAPKKVEIRDIDLPDPGPGQALVKVAVCGICTWDLFIFSGGFQNKRAFPFYFGHEGIGYVAKVGPGCHISEGQRVALRGSVQGGGHMASYSLQEAATLCPLPQDEVPDEHYMVEPVACCVNAMNITPVKAGDSVALVGAGYMGGTILQLLAMSPAAEVVVFEQRTEAIAYARGILAAPGTPPMRIVDTRGSNGNGGPFDIVIEATGVEPGFRLADSLARRGGRFVIFSWQHHPFEIDLGSWHMRGLTVHNSSPMESWNMTGCFDQAAQMLHTRRVDQSRLVTHVAPPEEAQYVYEQGLAKTDGYIKGVINWS